MRYRLGNPSRKLQRRFLATQDPDLKKIVGIMLANLKALRCPMSLKLHSLNSRLSYFPKNLREEQGERFHQDINELKRRYPRRLTVNMILDYWMLDSIEPQVVHKRKVLNGASWISGLEEIL